MQNTRSEVSSLPAGVHRMSEPRSPSSLNLPRPAARTLPAIMILAGVVAATGALPLAGSSSIGVVVTLVGTGMLLVRMAGLERTLRESDVCLAELTHVDTLGVATFREDGLLIAANGAFFRIFGRCGSETDANLRWSDVVNELQDPEENGRRRRSGFREIAVVRDGATRFAAIAATALPAGRILALAIDVTERVEAERALDEARAVLEARLAVIEQRAGDGSAHAALATVRNDLAEQRRSVVQLAEKLAAATGELEAFTYSVAHDLRAPLRTIDGFSRELLSSFEGQLGQTGDHYLRRIRAGTQRMGALIEALLELSRVSRVDLDRQNTDVTALARTVAVEQQQRLGTNAEVVIEEGLAANSDPRLTRIVLENLLGNALKFSSKAAAPRVEVSLVEDATGRVFRIRDNGAGFDTRYAQKLFAPFHRLHSAIDFEGTGIGLALVHRIIHRHGGTIRAEAELGKGASIYFTLEPGQQHHPPAEDRP